jgi:asparagine synthase (glutamine-hydrolysing)
MSAIFGIINKNGAPVEGETMAKARAALAHRVKDGWSEHLDRNTYFGFAQLSAYATQENENIPFVAGDMVFTANVHLHNRAELAARLKIPGEVLKELPDSALVFRSFREWGEGCVDFLDGEYAYAIWNQNQQELFISIDHIGYKSLYYYDSPGQFIFSSEIKAIEAVKQTPNSFDEESLVNYVKRNGDTTATYNKEIKALRGGNLLRLRNSSLHVSRYWNLSRQGKYCFKSDEEWYECLRDIYSRAVEQRLNPDRKIGLSLSGGLDSSAIACVISSILKKKNKPLYAFSSVLANDYKGNRKDEADYIRMISAHCGNVINIFESANGLNQLDQVERSFLIDEWIPMGVHFMNFAIMDRAKEAGVEIFFNGLGGDYWVSTKGDMMIWKLVQKGNWKEVISILSKRSRLNGKSFWHNLKYHYLTGTALGQKYSQLRLPWSEVSTLVSRLDKKSGILKKSESDFMFDFINSGAVGRFLQRLDTRNEAFQMAPAHPAFDRNLMQFLADVPERVFVADGWQRSLFRNAMKGVLPEFIRLRPDKKMYVVDTPERLSDIGTELEHLLKSADKNFYQYFSKKKLLLLMNQCKKPGLSEPVFKKLSYRASQAIISYDVMQVLAKKNFIFYEG